MATKKQPANPLSATVLTPEQLEQFAKMQGVTLEDAEKELPSPEKADASQD